MRAGLLRRGASLVSLSTLIWATQAFAETDITTTVTTPVATSTASNGHPDDVTVTATGAVQPTGSVAAVTVDSNNQLNNAGVIQIQDANNATGVLALGGHTGVLTNNLTITINETTVNTADSYGTIHAPFATGSGRYGIRVIGPGSFIGDLNNTSTGVITVQGNDSAAISVETALQGKLLNAGSINATGTNAYGIHTTANAPVSGNVSVLGPVSAIGQSAQAVSLEGDVGGQVLVEGAVTATGYRLTTRPTVAAVLSSLQSQDLLTGNSALSVSGSVARGLLVNAPPTINASNPDVDGDGVPDATETTGTVTSYGMAPAVVVGALGHSISLGNVGAGDDAYGIEIKGSVSGQGVYDGFSATGLQIGVASGGAVTTGGGLRINGSVSAASAQANATGVFIGSGASVPTIYNQGSITSTTTTSGATTTLGLAIQAGANVPVLKNAGTITATSSGDNGSPTAVLDQSGTLTDIETTNGISAVITPAVRTDTVTGKATAIDVSANTTGVHLLEYDTSGGVITPVITGAVLFGSGADRLDILAGKLNGDMSLGAGANVLNIDGGAAVAGALTANGGTVALNIGTGSLQINNTGRIALSSLSLANASTLVLTIDPAANANTLLDVAGAANIAGSAKIGLQLTSLLKTSGSYTLIHATSLTTGVLDPTLLGQVPFLYNAAFNANTAAGTVSVDLSRKTAAQLQLPASISGAYEPMVTALGHDQGLSDAVLSQTTRAGVVNIYNQLLPNHSGAVFQMMAENSEAFARPIDDRQGANGGAWAQEVNYGAVGDGGVDVRGYKGWGFGLVGGYERPVDSLGVLGFSVGLSSSEIKTDGAAAAAKLTSDIAEGAVYWRGTWNAFSADARVAGDYLHVRSRRVVSLAYANTSYFNEATGTWSGYGVTARAHAAYEIAWGRIYARPQISVDYIRLSEGSYSEKGGGDGLDLYVEDRTSSRASGFAGVAVGRLFGEDRNWGPELLVGYKTVVDENLGQTRSRFISGGDTFATTADQIGGSGVAAHLAIKGEDGAGGVAMEAGTEMRDGLTLYDLRLTAHFQF